MDRHRWSNLENEEVRRKDRHCLSPSQGLSPSESVARIVAIWVYRKDRRCLSSSQGSSPSKSVARIVAIWVCRKDCRCLSSLQGSSPSESVARNRHWVKMMDCRKDCRKDGSSQRSLQGSSQGLLLTELHRRRWFGFGSLIAVWGFFFFFDFFKWNVCELFWAFELKRPKWLRECQVLQLGF